MVGTASRLAYEAEVAAVVLPPASAGAVRVLLVAASVAESSAGRRGGLERFELMAGA